MRDTSIVGNLVTMKLRISYIVGVLFRLGWVTMIVIVLLALTKHFVFDIMPVSGISMYPTFHNRDIIVLNKLSYLTTNPKRGDVIVLRFPGDPEHERYIKRLVGLPGEHIIISNGSVWINDKKLSEPYINASIGTFPDTDITLGNDDYYLMGDNRPASSDSRIWGPAKQSDFIGKTFAIIWPRANSGTTPEPAY